MKSKMTLNQIAETHRVRIRRDGCGEPIIMGKRGHLYTEKGKPMICFSDDGQKRPLTKKRKTAAIKKLGLAKLRQEGDVEFIAELQPDQIRTALFEVLGVKRIRNSPGNIAALLKSRESRQEGVLPALECVHLDRGMSDYPSIREGR